MTSPNSETLTDLPWSGRRELLVGSIIDSSTSLLQKQTHDVVRFAMGSPAEEAIPTTILGTLAEKVRRESGASALDYAATEGDPQLRTALLGHLETTEEATDDGRLMITTGGMQGLDLVSKLFVDPGDFVVVEAPTYTNGTATLLSYGADVREVPVDANGMIVEALPELVERAGRPPKAIYVIPSFQNPSGTTLSLPRRMALLDLARRWNCMIIDDDPYGWLRFAGMHIPSLRALSERDPRVVSVRTFSKILAPGVRVGWVDADPRVVERMIAAKQAMDTCTNLPSQRMIAEFLTGGYLEAHLTGLREEYRLRKAAMQDALKRTFTTGARWTDPDGGFFLWLTLPDDIDTTELFNIALAEGVAFIPGPALSASGAFGNALRLCFASTGPERITEGVNRLARAVERIRIA